MSDQNTQDFVQCALFGESFNLRCAKEQKEKLQRAIASLQTKASNMMRENPNLTPTQAAILIALDSESTLLGFLNDKTPFENEALKLITKMKTSLQRANNDWFFW